MRYAILLLFIFVQVQSANSQKIFRQARKTIATSRYEEDGKKAASVSKNLKDTETTLLDFIKDEQTEGKRAEAYFIISEVYEKLYRIENDKIYLKRAYDTISYYTNVCEMYRYLYKCDSVAKLDANSYQRTSKKVQKKLLKVRPTLYNGCMHFLNTRNYELAYRLNDLYLSSANWDVLKGLLPAMEKTQYERKAFQLLVAAYYSSNYDGVIKYEKEALSYGKHLPLLYEYIADSYLQKGNREQWEKTAVYGLLHHSDNPYFFSELKNYLLEEKRYSDIIRLCEKMLEIAPQDINYMQSLMETYATMFNYDTCIEIAERILNIEVNHADANYYKGFCNCMLAKEEIEKLSGFKVKDKKYAEVRNNIISYYLNAMEPLERYRKEKPDMKEVWAPLLYNVYLYLNQGDKFSEIEKIIE